jgi:hypothetical protein
MALKVVPADDERCDIHTGRKPAKYICESCLKELGLGAGPAMTVRRGPIRRVRRALRHGPFRQARRAVRRSGWGAHPKLLIGAALTLLIAAVVVLTLVGGGEDEGGAPSEADVVNALDLLPNPAGSGWITSDGACVVVSIDLAQQQPTGRQGAELSVEATNQDGTVAAVVVQNDYTISQDECVAQVETALRNEF